MTDFNVTLAEEEDASAVTDLLHRCREELLAAGVRQWTDRYPTAEDLAESIDRGETWLLRLSGRLAATVTVDREMPEQFAAMDWSVPAEQSICVHRLAVAPPLRRLGLGTRLMFFCEELARRRRLRAVRLEAFSDNRVAVAMYEKLGYAYRGDACFPGRKAAFFCYEKVLD